MKSAWLVKKLLALIHQRLCEISGKDEAFGGYNIVIGDFCQIKPVKVKYAFNNHLLWTLFTPLFLTQNQRQSSDPTYMHILNRARVGLLTDEDHRTLKSCLKCEPYDTEKYPGTIRIFPKRAKVDKYNTLCQEKLTSDAYTHDAQHFFSQRDFHPCADVPEDCWQPSKKPQALSWVQSYVNTEYQC